MKHLTLLACLLFTAPAWADDAVHHIANVMLDPAQGAIEIKDQIHIAGQGRTAFALSPVFVVKALSVDGVSQAPACGGGLVLIDLGGAGKHDVRITTQAKLTTQSQHSQPPFLGPEGGFLTGDWLAHPPGSLATWTIDGETPTGQKWLTPGQLMFEDAREGRYRASFQNMQPSAPPMLITGPFLVAEKMAGETRVRTYFHAELSPLADGYLTDAARYVEHYAKKIGPFPYPGFAMVSGPVPVGLGLPGMTYMGRRVLALPFIRATSLPHEVLHNWWGNAVEVDYASGNWAEGLTTYQADHAQAASKARDGGREKRLEWLRNYAALPPERDAPVTAFRSKSHDASQVVGYGKVAYIFHMLKTRLGAAVFDKALRRFYVDNRHTTAGWAQIQTAFESDSGKDLGAFFDAWLNRTGAPALTLEDVRVQGQRLTFTLIQTQDGPAYPLSLSAALETRAGDQRLRLEMTKKRERYTVQADARPVALTVDPAFDVFRRLDAMETPPIFRDVTLNTDTRLVAPGKHPIARTLARALAEGLMQGPVAETQAIAVLPLEGTLIVAGLKADVLAFLEQSGLPRPPKSLDASAQGLAYVVREASGRTTLVAMADDADSLQALARVLPHYKRRSFAVLNAGRVTDKGTWPAPPGPLAVRLDHGRLD